jgi:rubrerythrin
MTHLIEDNGRFAGAVTKLLREHPAILYHDRSSEGDAIRKKKAASKTKYTCPVCGLNAWAKPEAPLVCGNCQEAMQAEEANALTR